MAAPFLSSLEARSGKAQAAAAPQRLIVMFTHYGCITSRFFPTKSHGALTADDLGATTLKHLAPYVGKILVPRGIRGMNEWTPTMSRGQGNDQHTQVMGSYFTCQPITPNSNDPFSFNTATKFNAMPIGRSLDHVIAEQLSPGKAPLLIRVGNRTDTPNSGFSYSAAEMPFPGLGAPAQVWSELTGLFKDGPLSPDSYQALRGKSVIDLVRDDLDALERVDMSQADRNKLEAWKALLDDTGGIMGRAQCSTGTATLLGATQSNVDAVGIPDGMTTSDPLMMPVGTDLDGADVYSSIAALAAVCGLNPVILLKYPAQYIFKGLGLTIESHTLSHRLTGSYDEICTQAAIDRLLLIDDYYARKFARLVGLLDGVQEGDGTVLDNSATVWFQELSDGNAHNLNNLPIVQAGSAGGYFKTGWAINVEDGSANLSVGYSETGCGTPLPDFGTTGTDPKVANAPINKYYCNLMNALGVRAGADGFPLAGGSGEVTHYGMYDRTEDFAGGGTKPPLISDPGEFSALRAT